MASLRITLFFLVAAVALTIVHGVCDSDRCFKMLVDKGTQQEICRGFTNAINCAETTVLNNSDCDTLIITLAQELVKQGKEKLEAKCSVCGLMSSVALCLGLSVLSYLFTTFT